MQSTVRLILATFASVLLLSMILPIQTQAHSLNREKREVSDPALEIAVLEDILQALREDIHSKDKRRFDAGYGSRYGVAQSVGSKLMALKQAADWNGPGRKRRSAETLL